MQNSLTCHVSLPGTAKGRGGSAPLDTHTLGQGGGASGRIKDWPLPLLEEWNPGCLAVQLLLCKCFVPAVFTCHDDKLASGQLKKTNEDEASEATHLCAKMTGALSE